MKKLLLASLLLLVTVALGTRYWYLPHTDKQLNVTLNAGPYQVSAEAQALHAKLAIADLHADSLLWSRDLNQRSTYGHVDVPRLLAGNVAVQAFTVVTKTTRDASIDTNNDAGDSIRLLAMGSFWPISSWSSLTERALHQARQLHRYAAASGGKLTLLQTAQDVNNYLAARQRDAARTAGFLGIEGAAALDGKLENFDRLYDAGFRMIGLAHFHDNEFAGSAHGGAKYGLTEQGRELVERMQNRKVLIDLAHCSAATIEEVLKIARRPVVVSHTGVKGTCNNNRNLSDDHLKRIAATGGVIGIGFWDTATCGKDADAIARAISHAVNIAGLNHVALGSDYDGAITAPFDASGMALLTEALMEYKFTEAEIRKIMGENVIRLLQTHLP